MNPVGVYKRGDFWWYRIGRHIRRSSGSKNMEDAVVIRARALAAENHRMVDANWKREVESHAQGAANWLRRTHASIQKRTKLRKWESALTLQELHALLLQSGGLCALTGIPMVIDAPKRDPFSISVDRIDSSRGYCYGNVRLICLAVNLAMSHWGEEALMTIARALVGRDLLKALHTGRYTTFSQTDSES
jgi:hypothetical protein